MAFVDALAQGRKQAEDLERDHPDSYQYQGGYGWETGTISDFLWAALAYLDDSFEEENRTEASWGHFAHFLYTGKIYE
ncbi:MAG: hypothetical protein K1Y36_22360 [Blastocatellia bacterium]|nr:hypothetical protein [Blastocatellia bacterium]